MYLMLITNRIQWIQNVPIYISVHTSLIDLDKYFKTTNTAFFHNNTQNEMERIPKSRYTSSFPPESYFVNKNSKTYHTEKKKDKIKDILHSADIQNVLLSAFGRIFDIVLYPDIKNISRLWNAEKKGYHDVSSIFYHGYLKGRKEDTDVSVTYNNIELVRKHKHIIKL